MNILRLAFLNFFLAVPGLSGASADTRDVPPQVVGKAYSSDDGHFLYSEFHYCEQDAQECLVEYRDSYGGLLARKLLDYRTGAHQPSLEMWDFRQSRELRFSSEDSEGLVVDAGFDNYVRSNWQGLASGDTLRFPFQVLGLERPLKMKASLDRTATCDEDELCLEVALDSWLLGVFMDPITLSYAKESKRLMRFSGLSNIRGEKGETLKVDIHYEYGDRVLLVGPPSLRRADELTL